ncbi:MAG: cardiolipin synthase ClsB [Burkholderiales bacterium]|nr:cardiolipin synthase ClsB [Burkholderiales bacterium]
MKSRWKGGNRALLLENGEAYYPAVFSAIGAARHEVIVETFIVYEDKVGRELQRVLIDAARRGVRVDVMVDGYGSAGLSAAFRNALVDAGVFLRTFDPQARPLGLRLNVLRRMHRKLVVIDGRRAFVGGINFSSDHLADFGPLAKQDFAVELEGPIVADIHRFAMAAIGAGHPRGTLPPALPAAVAAPGAMGATGTAGTAGTVGTAGPTAAGETEALFVTRDNLEHRNDIERHYCAAIRSARKQVLIANAYFFPGYQVLRQLGRAARRGVDVRLILQGEPDMPIARRAASTLYGYLQRHGVKVHEYRERPLHGKVAVIDDDWSTVGSSNLDPLSLSLNLEANVILRGSTFAEQLRARLQHLIEHHCREVEPQGRVRFEWWQALRTTVIFHFLRRFSSWASYLPRHEPRLEASERVPDTSALENAHVP